MQFVGRVTDVSPLLCREAGRNPIETMQPHHVIDAEHCGMTHLESEVINDMLVTALSEAFRYHRRESPVLSFAEEHIGRRASVRVGCEKMLVLPNIEAAAAYAYRQVQIKADVFGPAALHQSVHLLLGCPLSVQMVALVGGR